MSVMEKTLEHIQQWVYNAFPVARERGIGNAESLLESGIIDSMGTLEVVDFLESEFGFEVLDDEMVADHFDSIQSIATYVVNKQGTTNILSD